MYSGKSIVTFYLTKEFFFFDNRVFYQNFGRRRNEFEFSQRGDFVEVKEKEKVWLLPEANAAFTQFQCNPETSPYFPNEPKHFQTNPLYETTGSATGERETALARHWPRGNKKKSHSSRSEGRCDHARGIGSRQVRTKHLALYPCQTLRASGSQIPVVTRLLQALSHREQL